MGKANETPGKKFDRLVEIIRRLRAPDGCPWDREQTHASLLPFFLEEAYEVIESVDQENWELLQEELGDILLHAVFQAAIAEEEGTFRIGEALDTVNAKLVRRHPHVFGDAQAEAPFHARRNWETVKHREKGRQSRLDGVPVDLPALVRAQRLQQKASYAGFDWEKIEQVWNKVHEELHELRDAQSSGVKAHLEEEIGDLLFAIVNLARFLELSAEDALRKCNQKFIRRFRRVEAELARRKIPIEEATLAEMDAIWEELKREEKER
jgi:tetrapyrrole methylase family protein/MazG family protein